MAARALLLAGVLAGMALPVRAAPGREVQARMDEDLAAGRPLVAHVVVALCDNEWQGIVPVPASLGNGERPETNLYWGALYGVRAFLARQPAWTVTGVRSTPSEGVLQRIIFQGTIDRRGKKAEVFIVADAWRGREIASAVRRFLEMAAGKAVETVRPPDSERELGAGGRAHLIAYVGHDALMDFTLADLPNAREGAPPRSAVVLACASKQYFAEPLERGGSHQLLLTTGLMAPEAYTLDAVLRAWLGGASAEALHGEAAEAYHEYQKCGIGAARRLFAVSP